MVEVVVRESEAGDADLLAANMRAKDAEEMRALGVEPLEAIRACYADAVLRWTYLVDGEVAAMSGLGTGYTGSLISDVGYPYLLTANVVERAPVSFLREAKKAVAEMLLIRRILEGWVLSDYHGAVRLLGAIGFTVGEPRPFGVNGAKFSPYRMER